MARDIRRFDDEIRKLYMAGLSGRDIAEKIGMSRTFVFKRIARFGIQRSHLEWQTDKSKKTRAVEKTVAKRRGVPQDLARQYHIDKDLFRALEKPFDSYMYGIIVTDGHVGDRTVALMVSVEDIEWMRILSERLGVPLKIDNRGYPYLNINSVEVVDTLRRYGLNKNKTEFPQDIFIPTNETDFLRGLIDGDGCVCIPKNGRISIKFCGTNKKLVEWVCSKFRENGSRCNISNCKNAKSNLTAKRPYKTDFYSVTCSGKAAQEVLKAVYYAGCFALPRKYKKAVEGINGENKPVRG